MALMTLETAYLEAPEPDLAEDEVLDAGLVAPEALTDTLLSAGLALDAAAPVEVEIETLSLIQAVEMVVDYEYDTLDLHAGLTQVLSDGESVYLYGRGRVAQRCLSVGETAAQSFWATRGVMNKN